MSNYVKSTNFATKDALPSGSALKVIKGTEIDDEFEAIETAIATKPDSDDVDAQIEDALESVYPVGSVYINAAVATNPATLLGFGTWAAFGTGRVLVGVDSGDSSFNALGETGGSKNAIVVSHSHSDTFAISTKQLRGTFKTDDQSFGTGVFSRTTLSQNSSTGSECCASTISMNADHNHSITGSVSSNGSSGTNANLQPYITVYMWKRTA